MTNEIQLVEQSNLSSSDVYIISHGSNKGKDSSLIRGVADAIAQSGWSAITYNFRYFDTHEPPSQDLSAELNDLREVYGRVRAQYAGKRIHLIGKSIGGVVTSWFAKEQLEAISTVSILGLLPHDVDFGDYQNPVLVVQGEVDPLGDEDDVYEAMERFKCPYELNVIARADHSYRGTGYDTDENYESDAIALLITWLHKHAN